MGNKTTVYIYTEDEVANCDYLEGRGKTIHINVFCERNRS